MSIQDQECMLSELTEILAYSHKLQAPHHSTSQMERNKEHVRCDRAEAHVLCLSRQGRRCQEAIFTHPPPLQWVLRALIYSFHSLLTLFNSNSNSNSNVTSNEISKKANEVKGKMSEHQR